MVNLVSVADRSRTQRRADHSAQRSHPQLSQTYAFPEGNPTFDRARIHIVAMAVADNLGQIRFLGGKLGKALAEEYDVSTVSDLL